MKKINLLVTAFLCGTGLLIANPVAVNVAQKAASNFYATNHSAAIPTLSLAYTESDASGVPLYYIFNVNSTKGFVIVTGDDAAHPIIGYSDEAAFVIPTSDNNVAFWLRHIKKQIVAIRANHVVATADITNEWTSYTTATKATTPHNLTAARDSVLPLCKTTWDQSPYYNAMCPGGSVTGCVATAMAQIMRYWEYPSIGIDSSCYSDEEGSGFSEDYGQLCAVYDTSHYAWSAMTDIVARTNNEVAKLMYDCGVSVDMDYTPTGSGAQVMGGNPSAQYSYITYFGYDASTIGNAFYYSADQASWISTLETELNNKRPMQFQGFDSVGEGHSWVCDGYSALNDVHMNWGWSGYDDGYYAVTLLNPSPYTFNQDIGALTGIEPPPGALGVKQVVANATAITVYPNPSHGVFTFNMPNNSNTYQIRVYNVLGQQVTTAILNTTSNTINISTQAKGVYIYKVLSQQTGASISTGRLVVE